MTKILSGIDLIQLPLPSQELRNVNVYLVHGNGESLLIDTGLNTEQSFYSLKKQMDEIGVNLENISQIIATHCHSDHYAMAGRLKQLSQANISLHYLEKDIIVTMQRNRDTHSTDIDQWFRMNGAPPFEQDEIRSARDFRKRYDTLVMPDTIVQGGETITIDPFNLKIMWTPGHSPGHISLYEPHIKLLFSGDFILPDITPNISVRPQSKNRNINPLGSYISSLKIITQLEISLVLPSHGNPFSNLQQRASEISQHHKQRNSEILKTINNQPKTAHSIASEITWIPQQGGVSWQNLSKLNRRMAVLETLAHLEFMRSEKKVDKLVKDDIIYYQRI